MTFENRTKKTAKKTLKSPLIDVRPVISKQPLHPSPKKQAIMFTIMTRSVRTNADTCPVSIYVSPRLYGATSLGAFPDWLKWTRKLKENGFSFEIQCGTQKTNIPINPAVLKPELWEELFKEDTIVRSYEFPDYNDKGILSYSVRQTLSALKATYQKASVELALPDNEEFDPFGKERQTNRNKLQDMVNGLQIHWDDKNAARYRTLARIKKPASEIITHIPSDPITGQLDDEGTIIPTTNQPTAQALTRIALPFAAFHHMPTPKYDHKHDTKTETLTLDTKNLLDFHQALSALNSYPELLRALGLVFDLELPINAVPFTALSSYGTFWVNKVNAGWTWSMTTETPQLKTAYVFLQTGNQTFFCTAPRFLGDSSFPTLVLGLLRLDQNHFGLAQVDVDGSMHKTIMLAETLNPSPETNKAPNAQPIEAANPEIFDPEATLPAMRSGGFSLYADKRAYQLIDILSQSKVFNDAVEGGTPQQRPFFEEDLVRGYRLDIWDSQTEHWHSLHMRKEEYIVGKIPFTPQNKEEEGFNQMAVTQPADGAQPITNDLYLHEAMARWNGWSLSAPMPSKHLSRYPQPDKAVPKENDPEYYENQPDTPFKLATKFTVTPKSLPRLKFGTKYRIRARAVDIAGNSLSIDDDFANTLSTVFALPLDPEGYAYLRFEPVAAPLVVLKDAKTIEDPAMTYDRGSALDRLVIRTFNDDPTKDNIPADTTAADRHIIPPRTSVELGERLGMFDDAQGKIKADKATYDLISKLEASDINRVQIKIKGHTPSKDDKYPLETGDKIEPLPYLPDPMSRGAAIRDLPGTPSFTVGKAEPGAGTPTKVNYDLLSDPNPRSGSATLISFDGENNWQKTVGFRLALNEPQPNQEDVRPQWDPTKRVLSIYLPKGQTKVVPLSSYMNTQDLKLMGIWKWLREYIERTSVNNPQQQRLKPNTDDDRIAHILQRVVEGGHWMLTPPRLLTLVHAVQQPLGKPAFSALNVEHTDDPAHTLQTAPIRKITDPAEMAPITAYRRIGENSAYLMGSLLIHGASTAKVDIRAEWQDPVDDLSKDSWELVQRSQTVEELSLKHLREWYIPAKGTNVRSDGYYYPGSARNVGYYDPEHDQIAFVRKGDWTGTKQQSPINFYDAAPRHLLNDNKHHIINYTAVATSRYREYFNQDPNLNLNFTRESKPVTIDVPASARPLAPQIAYVIPTFGWERQTETNLKRSVRFGGGLRVYLHRPWFSSGADELLGVALWSDINGSLNQEMREKFKPYFTQWGMDPIWQTGSLSGAPYISSFPDRVEQDTNVTLEEKSAMIQTGKPARINVVGFKPEYDPIRQLWYADLTVNLTTATYAPFIRLALVRYQPHALADAKVSRVVLADFAQLTPDRTATVTADPYHPRVLKVTVSGVAPTGPSINKTTKKRPTQIKVAVQQRIPGINSDLAWKETSTNIAAVKLDTQSHPELILWAGKIEFANPPKPGEFRLLITEAEYVSGDITGVIQPAFEPPNRIIYTEILEIDTTLIT